MAEPFRITSSLLNLRTDKGRAHGSSGERVWALALSLLPSSPGRVLDCGSGGGYLLEHLRQEGWDPVGIDQANRLAFPNIEFHDCDLNGSWPIADASVDTVLATEVIGYLENPHQFMREAYRVLKPGGVAVVTMPNSLSTQSRLRFFGFGAYKWYPHPRPEFRQGSAFHAYREPLRLSSLIWIAAQEGLRFQDKRFGNPKYVAISAILYPLFLAIYWTTYAVRPKWRKDMPKWLTEFACVSSAHVALAVKKEIAA